MLGNEKIIKWTEKENIIGQTEKYIRATLKIITSMVKVYLNVQMVEYTMEAGKKIKKMESVPILNKMVVNVKKNGQMVLEFVEL